MIDFTTENLIDTIASSNRDKPIFLVKLFPMHAYGFVAFESSLDKQVWVPCIVSETRYPLSDNYKITLAPVRDGFGLKHFYQSDFVHMVRSSDVLVLNQDIPWQDQVPPSNAIQVITKASGSLIKRMASWFKLPNLNN